MIPVILSGGNGSRLWPLSRKLFPKQFLAMTGEQTLFQQTVERLAFEGMQQPLLVCNTSYKVMLQSSCTMAHRSPRTMQWIRRWMYLVG